MLYQESSETLFDPVHQLRQYVEEAHRDAREKFEAAFRPTLDLDKSTPTPAGNYPWDLPLRAKQGYFGECLAAILIEHSPPFGVGGFRIPAFLFRFHNAAFDWILRNNLGEAPSELVGRFGNDLVAFRVDGTPKVVEALVVEAKCLTEHRMDTLDEAHRQISDSSRVPLSTYQIVQILQERLDPIAREMTPILQTFMNDQGAGSFRTDLIAYTCGQLPRRKSSWASTTIPNQNYTASRRLEVIETHLENIADVVKGVYERPTAGAARTEESP